MSGAAVHLGAGLLVALSEARSPHQPHLPNVHLLDPDQAGGGAGQQAVLGDEDPGRLQPHPQRLPRKGPRLLFLLGPEQRRVALQPLGASLPASEAHDARAAATHAGAHQRIAASVPTPGDVPASGRESRHDVASLRL